MERAARTWKRLGDLRDEVMGAASTIRGFSEEASRVSFDACERARGVLMSIEARAAQVYWDAFSLLLPRELGFPGRVKRGAEDVVNCMLNYGYSILSTEVWLSILRAGLDPWAGFLHADSQRRPALVYDLMEPFRAPVVDRAVLSLVAKKGSKLAGLLGDGMLTGEGKRAVVEAVVERLNLQVRVTGRRLTVSGLILLVARRLVARLVGSAPKFRVPQVTL